MTPTPIYTFLVNNIDYSIIYAQPLPSSIDNVIEGLNSQAIYIPYVNNPLKNGDIFTLYGKRAQIVYEMFIGKQPKVLEFLAKTDQIPTLITKKLEFDRVSLPIASAISNECKAVVLNYSGSNAFFLLNSFDSKKDAINVSLYLNGLLHPSSPASSFSLTLNYHAALDLKIQAPENFYFTYSELTF